MTPAQVAASYDQIAAIWNSPEFHRANGLAQHERAQEFAVLDQTGVCIVFRQW